MKISFKKSEAKDPQYMGGIKVPYASSKRTFPKLRWYLILFLISLPVLWMIKNMLIETVFVSARGYVTPLLYEIKASHNGVIKKVYVELGMDVKANQPLMDISSAELIEKKIQIGSRLQVLDEQARLRLEKAGIQSLEGRVNSLTERSQFFEQQYQSKLFLREQKAATQAEVARALEDWNSAKQDWYNASQELEKLQGFYQQPFTQEELQEQIKLSEELKWIEEDSKSLAHPSPFDARVVDVYVQEGQPVALGTALLSLAKSGTADVSVYLHPKHIDYAVPGQKASLVFQDGTKLEGEVIEKGKYTQRIPAEYVGPLGIRHLALLVKIRFLSPLPQDRMIFGLPVSVQFQWKIPFLHKNKANKIQNLA